MYMSHRNSYVPVHISIDWYVFFNIAYLKSSPIIREPSSHPVKRSLVEGAQEIFRRPLSRVLQHARDITMLRSGPSKGFGALAVLFVLAAGAAGPTPSLGVVTRGTPPSCLACKPFRHVLRYDDSTQLHEYPSRAQIRSNQGPALSERPHFLLHSSSSPSPSTLSLFPLPSPLTPLVISHLPSQAGRGESSDSRESKYCT